MKWAVAAISILCSAAALPQSAPTVTPPGNAPAQASPLDAAEIAIEQREFAKARQLVMEALTAHPQDTRALYDLGFVEFSTDHNQQAEQDYRRVIELDPSLPQAHLALARLLASTDRKDEARQELLLVTTNPKADGGIKGEAWRALANLDLAADPNAARTDLLHALEVSPETPQDTFLTGRLAESLGDPDTAEKAYRKLLAQKQMVAEADAALGRILLRQQHSDQALALLQDAQAAYPDDVVLTAEYATALANTGQPAKALMLLEKAHDAEPSDMTVTRLLADVANPNGRPDEAEALYVELLKLNPKDPELLSSYGSSLIRQQRFFEAEPPLQQAVALKPTMGEAWGSLAFVASKREQYQDVLTYLTQRKKYLPENASTYFLWATAYDKLRHTKEAVTYYHLFLEASGGKFPDQEFQIRHRLAVLEHK
jgi:Flp pilus assembly protein TadD